jgi:hypothetical protein
MQVDQDDFKRLQEHFKLVCKKCGSDNVAVSLTPPVNYGGQTGWQSGDLSIGCNACKNNDLYITI